MVKLIRRIFLVAVIITAVVHVWKPLPDGVRVMGEVYTVPSDDVEFFSDLTYVTFDGERHSEQAIFNEVFRMIRAAQSYVLLDMFLYNSFQGKESETTRPLAQELTDLLIQKKQENPAMSVVVVTDPVNTVYGGAISPELAVLEEAGVQVVVTDLRKLRDSNPVYSAIWRTFIQWLGNSSSGGFVAHPFSSSEDGVGVRSYLLLLNFKANHRKLVVADVPQPDGTLKISTLVTSANPHDGSSAHSNVAVRVDSKIWRDTIESEQAVATFSNTSIPGLLEDVRDDEGNIEVQLLTEGAIRDVHLELLEQATLGDAIDIAQFYLSDRKIVKALLRATQRAVAIRLILDPNKDAFGHTKIGVPNRQVANELMRRKGAGAIQVRWCDTHGEQCHSKLSLFDIAGTRTMILGSANLTRRNIGDYNLETDILVRGGGEAISDAYAYFERVWNNEGNRFYSTEYETYHDSSLLKTLLYQFQERLGMSSF
jgi:phosphatidylserine/phosphatidylglycerophosphate/cardiolipin synthase-like enzyme